MTEIPRVILKSSQLMRYHVIRSLPTKNPVGATGADLRLTAQSMNVCVPLIANTIVFMSSMGNDLMTIALVPILQSESTCVSLS